jgi:hypothetical protein
MTVTARVCGRHGHHHKIYNLCLERGYELDGYFSVTERFPMRDHHPCVVRPCVVPPPSPRSLVTLHARASARSSR